MPNLCRHAVGAVLTAVLLAAGAGGCGGSGAKSSSATTPTTAGTATEGLGGSATVSTGPVRGTLRGGNHAPKVNRPWLYSVRVTSAAGQGLSGTVAIQFVYGDQIVGRDTPPTHPVTSGRWHDTITFPAAAIGMPLTFRAVVHTRLGTITLDWPVKVTA
ncbi:MAG TPA: hypothetical protein VMU39_13725 [Solirubrobacteraceae bacterium]|nr:hypothetical protein [Solirubrobacteraceae bacterium]